MDEEEAKSLACKEGFHLKRTTKLKSKNMYNAKKLI
jgi:hypothetical protein